MWLYYGKLFCTKSDIFTQPKVYDAETKSLMCQNGLFTICLSLVHNVLDRSKSTSTYCWSFKSKLTSSGELEDWRLSSSLRWTYDYWFRIEYPTRCAACFIWAIVLVLYDKKRRWMSESSYGDKMGVGLMKREFCSSKI